MTQNRSAIEVKFDNGTTIVKGENHVVAIGFNYYWVEVTYLNTTESGFKVLSTEITPMHKVDRILELHDSANKYSNNSPVGYGFIDSGANLNM